jgi:methylated-DNA-protein-cysteine methyltransferase related protein
MQARLKREGVMVLNDKIQHFNVVFWNPSTEL